MLLSCGDALIDFIPMRAPDGRDAYVPVVGGSCLNVAVTMARLGAPAGFVGGLSTDLFGEMIARHAADSQVDLGHAVRSGHETTLAFVRFIDGEPHYVFYDDNSAAVNWTYQPGSLPYAAIDAIHTGSTTLIQDEAARRVLAMISDARPQTTISFDPNCRPNLIHDREAYARRMAAFAAKAHIVRMSDADFDYLHGGRDYAAKAEQLIAGGASLVVITRGPQGALAWHAKAGAFDVPAPPTKVVDTIGAGDTFQGALLFALRELGRIEAKALADIGGQELNRALAFAIACAAITCSRASADPPRRAELSEELLASLRRET
jgi:fructokinase